MNTNNMIRFVMWLYLLQAARCSPTQEMFDRYAIEFITETMKNELNSRLGVKGAMGGNVTLTSTSPLGSGKHGFAYPGEMNGTPVAIKFVQNSTMFKREYKCYEQMGATSSKDCEKFGTVYIYHTDTILDYSTMVMTKLDTKVLSARSKTDSFSDDTILIIFRDMIRILKYIHSKGIINGDIKPGNMMLKGADVYVVDYNQCAQKAFQSLPNYGSPWYMPIGVHLDRSPAEYQDMESLLYAMLVLADVELPWNNLPFDQLLGAKQRVTGDSLCGRLKRVKLVDLYKQFYNEVFASAQEDRLPQYDGLYKMFDDALYNGRNRSERIVFEWLSAEEKFEAMSKDLPSIESIVF